MRHAPTSEELEQAVARVLEQADKELTAKEVRERLQKENGGWKIPAERRIAKFVKRQNSRKAGLLGRFFKTDRHDNNNNGQEAHPRNVSVSEDDGSVSVLSEKERKSGFRKIASIFSPSKSRKGAKLMPETPQSVPEEPSEAASEKKETPPDTSSSPLEAEQPTLDEVGKPEIVSSSGEGNVDTENPAPAVVDEAAAGADVETTSKDLIMEAYVDDNDGKTKDCNCGACIVM